MDTMEQQES
jgi:feruloyl esterase